MRPGLFWMLCLMGCLTGARAEPHGPTVILISVDALRWDYLEHFAPPHLRQLADAGLRLTRLIPAYPSKTYPNHYTLVTGLRAENHGIVGNDMFDPEIGRFFRLSDRAVLSDPRWWGGEPLWTTAQRQGKRAATVFWPGSDVAIGGVRPARWLPYEHDKPHDERVAQILAWLDLPAAERPDFLTLYFSHVDDVSHRHGPLAPETRAAVLEVDRAIGKLLDGLATRGVADKTTLVVVSDHGMADVSPERIVYLDDVLTADDPVPEFTGPAAGLRLPEARIETYRTRLGRLEHVRVIRKTELPATAGYTRHRRIPDLLVIADEGWTVSTRAAVANSTRSTRGDHGFDPAYASMGATFIARGPGVPRGVTLPAMENIHVYNALCALLASSPRPMTATTGSRAPSSAMPPPDTSADDPAPVPLPITGELDLHTFRPQDLGELLPAYFEECRRRNLFRVRVIHGKGTGTLRTTVHGLLRRLPAVETFQLAGGDEGGWGATVVHLRGRG